LNESEEHEAASWGGFTLPIEPKGYHLLFQRYRSTAIAAEGGYPLQIAIRAWHGHYRTVAVHRVPAGREVPAAAFGPP